MEFQHVEYEKLIAFAAGELHPSEARVIAMHIASCAECSQTVIRFQSIRRLIRGDDSVEPPLAMKERAYSIFSDATATLKHVSDSLLAAFATDGLEPAYARELATHIDSCAECSRTVAHFQSIGLWLRPDDGQDPPSATLTRAFAILRKERRASIPWWQRISSPITFPAARRFAVALMLVLFILSTVFAYTTLGDLASTAYAAIPGDSLYSLKHQIEQIELMTVWDTAGKLDRHIAYAGYRIDESAALIGIPRLVEIPGTLTAFETETNLIVQTYNVLATENASRALTLSSKVEDALADYSIRLANLRDAAGEEITPYIDHAIATAVGNQDIVRAVANQLLVESKTPPFATLTPTRFARPATRIVPSLTDIPRSDVTATPVLSLQNTPVGFVPTITLVFETATPNPTFIGATATRTPTLPIATATRTATPLLATATRTPTPPVATATQSPTSPAPTATQTPPAATATQTANPPVPTATQTAPLATATQTPTPMVPTATPTTILPVPTATQTIIPPVPTATQTVIVAP